MLQETQHTPMGSSRAVHEAEWLALRNLECVSLLIYKIGVIVMDLAHGLAIKT